MAAERRIFINNMNNKLSMKLIESLRLDQKNKFTGTIREEGKLPVNFKPNIIKIDTNENYENPLFDNNYFIYSLENLNREEIEYIIKGLKLKKHNEDKVLVIVSSIMTWARSKQKTEKNPNEIEDDTPKNEDGENMEGNEEEKDYSETDLIVEDEEEAENKENQEPEGEGEMEEQKAPLKKYLLKEKDYKLRVPSNEYYAYKSIETLALSASQTNPKLKSYIVCPGFIYGCGEEFFYNYFKVSSLNILNYRLLGFRVLLYL